MNNPSVLSDQIPRSEKRKYHDHFLTLRSKDGIIDKSTARDFFLKSGLSSDLLARIWDESDRNRDGFLDLNEFCVAMHLVVNAIRQEKTSKKTVSNGPVQPAGNNRSNPALSRSELPQTNGRNEPVSSGASNGIIAAKSSVDLVTKMMQNPVRPMPAATLLQPVRVSPFGSTVRDGNTDWPKNGRAAAECKDSIARKRKESQQLHNDVQRLRSERNTFKETINDLNKTRLADLKFVAEMSSTVRKKRNEVDELKAKAATATTSFSSLENENLQQEHLLTELRTENRKLQRNDSVRKSLASGVDIDFLQTLERVEGLRINVLENERKIGTWKKQLGSQMDRHRTLVGEIAKYIQLHQDLWKKFAQKRELCENFKEQELNEKLRKRESITDEEGSLADGSYSVIPDSMDSVRAIASYAGETADELTFSEGDLIQVIERNIDGWWLGEDFRSRRGYFPASFCASTRASPELKAVQLPTEPLRSALALFPYTAQNADELSFEENDVLDIIRAADLDNDWYIVRNCEGEQGLVPANYLRLNSEPSEPPRIDPSSFVPVPVSPKRQLVIRELIETEEKYLSIIVSVLQVYYTALKDRKACSEDELNQLFSVWHDIIDCTNTLVKAFKVRAKLANDGVIETIGDILCEYFPSITPYTKFCSNQAKMGELIKEKTDSNPVFAEVVRQCSSDSRMQGLPLAAAYMKPMQRMTQYPLLIKRILDLTPESHPDFADVKEALRKSELLCERVNEGVRATELTERLEWLDKHVNMESFAEGVKLTSQTNFMGPRTIVYAGSLLKAKSGRELVGILFNDLFLLTTPPRPLMDSWGNFAFEKRHWTGITLKLYKKPLLLSHCKAAALPDESSFSLTFPNSVNILLKAPTLNECKSWIKHFNKAVADFDDMEKQVNSPRNRSIKPHVPVGCCRLILMEGVELCPNERKNHCDAFCKVSVGSQEQRTGVIENTLNPKWDKNMTFILYDLENEFLSLTVFDYNPFAVNRFLGRTELRLKDVYQETKGMNVAVIKRLVLHEVVSGELVVKIDIQLFQSSTSTLPFVMPLASTLRL